MRLTKRSVHGCGYETLSQMMASQADWVSPGPWDDQSMKNVYASPPNWKDDKVSVLDTDHVWGHGIDYHWVWKSFLRGHNVLFMDLGIHCRCGLIQLLTDRTILITSWEEKR